MQQKCLILTLGLVLIFSQVVIAEVNSGVSQPGTLNIQTKPQPKLPANITISDLKFTDEDGNNFLDALEEGKISFTVSNTGKGTGFALKTEIKPETNCPGLEYAEINIGDFVPATQKEVVIPLSANRDILSQKVNLTIFVRETNGFDSDPVKISFETKEFHPADLVVSEIGIEEDAVVQKNRKIDLGESILVKAIVQNNGSGKATGVNARVVKEDDNIFITSKDDKFFLENLQPGEWKVVEFGFMINKRYAGSENLPIYLNLYDKRNDKTKKVPLNLTVGKPVREIKEITFIGKEDKIVTKPVPTLTVDVDTKIPKTELTNPDGIAVIIGVKDYKNTAVPVVDYALNDTVIMKEYLINVLGYREGNIIYLENPTKGDMEKVFGTKDNYQGQLFNYVKPGVSDMFIYYAGHGAPDIEDKTAYFVPSDCDPNYVRLGGYSLDLFYANLAQVKARNKTVVIDACFCGSSEKGMLLTKGSSIIVVPKSTVPENVDILTAATKDEIASWYPEKKHSLFTYYFLKGLRGEADKNKDNQISFSELKEYLGDKVTYEARRNYGRTQTPTFTGNENKVVVKY